MASHHMLAAGIFLLICTTQLGLTVPIDEPSATEELDKSVDEAQKEETSKEKEDQVDAAEVQSSTPSTTSSTNNVTTNQTLPSSSANASTATTTLQDTSKAATAAASVSLQSATESAFQSTSPTTSLNYTSTVPVEQDGPAPDTDKPKDALPKGPSVVPDEEIRFWWSDSTWLSVVIPVGVGLGSALFLICWVCCLRLMCCRRCGHWRSPQYKQRSRATSGPAKKALRDDFRQLRQRDRIKLLAESSDEEF